MPYDIRSPSAISNVEANPGNGDWLNPTNVSYEDTMVASWQYDAQGSAYLYVRGFNFSIPRFATITGIKARIKGYATGSLSSDIIQLCTGPSTTIGSDKAAEFLSLWSSSSRYHSFGGDGELWDTGGINVSDINSSGFGLLVSVSGSSGCVAYIDHVELTVYYTDGVDIMSTDTVKKIINSNAVNQGAAIGTTTVKGEYDKINPTINKAPLIDAVNAKMAGKFDDTTYYSN